jgi:hypothetical protein
MPTCTTGTHGRGAAGSAAPPTLRCHVDPRGPVRGRRPADA